MIPAPKGFFVSKLQELILIELDDTGKALLFPGFLCLTPSGPGLAKTGFPQPCILQARGEK